MADTKNVYVSCPICRGSTSTLGYEKQHKKTRKRFFTRLRICHDCKIIIPIDNAKFWNGMECVEFQGIFLRMKS